VSRLPRFSAPIVPTARIREYRARGLEEVPVEQAQVATSCSYAPFQFTRDRRSRAESGAFLGAARCAGTCKTRHLVRVR
jgi:hypothetical protein